MLKLTNEKNIIANINIICKRLVWSVKLYKAKGRKMCEILWLMKHVIHLRLSYIIRTRMRSDIQWSQIQKAIIWYRRRLVYERNNKS